MYYDQRALDIINEWEALEFRHPAQKKAALQIAIAAALSTSAKEGIPADAWECQTCDGQDIDCPECAAHVATAPHQERT